MCIRDRIAPVQRLCRYPLLLRALRDATPIASAEHSRLCVTIQNLENSIKFVNKSKMERESEGKVAEMKEVVDGADRLKPKGFLLKSTFLSVASLAGGAPSGPELWYLFENIMLRCVPNDASTSKKPWRVLETMATARMWVSAEHPAALAAGGDEEKSEKMEKSTIHLDSSNLIAIRNRARMGGWLVVGEAGGDESDDDDDALRDT
eukprot:TRINITY_DN384_c0_g3_i2.p1 TRINITY_DN384_c0_g3~~TRINITY_DN384_c0_g3_i2.p1  ORF type:complete len:206 (-),score=72.74 TRINITY_DN384_c0_g3_i2:377-994(-)